MAVMPGNGGVEGKCGCLRQLRLRFRLDTGGRSLAAGVAGVVLATLVPVLVPSSASADVNSDQMQVSQLEQRIAQDGNQVQGLVSDYDQAVAQEQLDTNRIDAAQARLAADQRAESRAMTVLRRIALAAYMSDSEDNAALAIFDNSATSQLYEQEYTQVADAALRDAVDTVAADAHQTQATEAQLRSAQAQDQATVAQLASSRQAAQNALDQDDSLLSQAKSNLAQALQQQAEQNAEEEQQEEQELAAEATAAAAAAAATPPPTVTINPAPGSYTNPLRSINALNPERVDQGVDYSGFGPIYAIGDGTVLSIANAGWPGGTFIAYKLSDGPAAGLVVYAAEDIDPLVQIGQTVTAASVLGLMYEGPDGIETGWADPSGDGVSMARDYNQFSGANSTAFGANFSELLASLGAPPGVMQNEPATGSLPPNWPTW